MRLQLNRPHVECHAYLLPAPESVRDVTLLPADSYVIDAHDPSLIEHVLVRLPEVQPRVLVIGASFDNTLAFSLLFSGVRGLVRYDRMASELVRALQAVDAGAYWISRLQMAQFVDHLLERFPHPEQLSPLVRLSTRERQVTDGILCRLTNKEIASRLGLSERTVKFHVSNLLRKFGAPGRYDLTLSLLRQATGGVTAWPLPQERHP